mmetsp:Transcript_3693/g.8055  ORF Transcript_3693/g.8055 Transcript_3693/m.8055 type:complete len:125 (-) Transcript_3693:123-497(-)
MSSESPKRIRVVGVLKCINKQSFSGDATGLKFTQRDVLDAEFCALEISKICKRLNEEISKTHNDGVKKAGAIFAAKAARRRALRLADEPSDPPPPTPLHSVELEALDIQHGGKKTAQPIRELVV